MHRLFALALALAAGLLSAAPAAAHKANPNYLTRVDAITPSIQGLSIEVINRDDQLELHNDSGEEVIVEGYNEDPYARLAADGTVSVNTNSPAYYLNDDRYGEAPIPDGVDGRGEPNWKEVDKTGRFAWHDHRMHWMAKTRPAQVKDPDKRTTIFTWTVPIRVDGRAGDIAGTLFWTPDPKAPVGFIVVASAVVLVLCAGAIVVRRRRDREEGSTSEAW
jgi:hypothetical protein